MGPLATKYAFFVLFVHLAYAICALWHNTGPQTRDLDTRCNVDCGCHGNQKQLMPRSLAWFYTVLIMSWVLLGHLRWRQPNRVTQAMNTTPVSRTWYCVFSLRTTTTFIQLVKTLYPHDQQPSFIVGKWMVNLIVVLEHSKALSLFLLEVSSLVNRQCVTENCNIFCSRNLTINCLSKAINQLGYRMQYFE